MVKPRVAELTSELEMVTKEATVVGANAIPVGRFVKAGSGGIARCTSAGETALGASLEHPIPSVSNRTSDFADYAVGDTAVYAAKLDRYITIEAANQSIGAVALTDKVGTDASGKAAVTATTGHYVLGVQPEKVTIDSVVYLRFIPNWLTKEVVP
jgi:hypothetical protein